MAEYEDVCELEDSVSTISVDSVTISNLAVSNNLPRGNTTQGNSAASEHGSRQKKRVDSIPHDQMVQKLKEVEQRENEIEHVLIQNNNLMKLLLENSRESKTKVNTIKTNNMEYRRKMSELKGELEQKNNEIRSFSDGDKNANAQRLKIDQAAAAVKDLRDQLYEKDRVHERMKTKVEQDYSALVSENSYLKVQAAEAEAFKAEHERQCDTLSTSLEENQQIIESLSDQLLGEKKLTDDYKNQLAVLSCQVTELKRYYSMERHVRKQLQAKLQVSDPGHFSRSGMESRGFEPSIGATLAASHGEQTAPPSNSPFMEYSEHRHY